MSSEDSSCLVNLNAAGLNATDCYHRYGSVQTTQEHAKPVRAAESTFAANRAEKPPSTFHGTYHACRATGHPIRDYPTLTPEERARHQKRSRNRKEVHSSDRDTSKNHTRNPSQSPSPLDIATQLAEIQARLAFLERGSHDDDTSLGDARLACLERHPSGGLVLKAGGGKLPPNYAAIDSGAHLQGAPASRVTQECSECSE